MQGPALLNINVRVFFLGRFAQRERAVSHTQWKIEQWYKYASTSRTFLSATLCPKSTWPCGTAPCTCNSEIYISTCPMPGVNREAPVFAYLVENRPWLFTLCGLWGCTRILKMDWWPPKDIEKPKGKTEVHFSFQLIDSFPFDIAWCLFFFMISAIAWRGFMCFTGLFWSVDVLIFFHRVIYL